MIVSCAAGQAALFKAKLSGLGAEIVAVAEPEPLGRGGGIRFAAEQREEAGPVYALNGDELTDVDLPALLEAHEDHGAAAATIVVAPLMSQFGVVELADGERISGFREAPRLPHWVNAGVYVLDDEACTQHSWRVRTSRPNAATTSSPPSRSSPPRESCSPFGTKGSGSR